MKIDFITILIFSGVYLLLFATAEIAYHFLKVKVEYTRKYVHFFTGIISLFFPIYLNGPAELLILCGSFAVLLLLSLRFNFLQSVNAVERKTRGSILYPVVVIICFMCFWYKDSYSLFFVPILILAISDPLAALVGKKNPLGPYSIMGNSKTMMGSIVFLASATAIAFGGLYLTEPFNGYLSMIGIALVIGITTTFSEAISSSGYDNLAIPIAAVVPLMLML